MGTSLKAATPRPWRAYDMEFDTQYQVGDAIISEVIKDDGGPDIICTFDDADAPADEMEANIALIVRAVNSFDDLVAALEKLVARYRDLIDSGDCGFWDAESEEPMKIARAALAKAKGESP